MRILRKYQLDIIFLFFALTAIIWTAFFELNYSGVDPHDYEWLIVGPIIILYSAWIWKIREKINISERRKPTGKSLVYWIILGILIFSGYISPISINEYLSINIFFIIFTIFLADSYWDFKKITVNEVTNTR